MRKTKWLTRIIAAALAICMIFCTQGMQNVSAEVDQDKELDTLYVSEVKMFYGNNEDEARKFCEDEGYTFCPENLKEEAGEGAPPAYLGYKTTKDPGDAITDMTILDMKSSHYNEMSYQEYMDAHIKEYADEASRIMLLVQEFRTKYEAKSPNALSAFDSLNMIYVDEKKSHTNADNLLGTYLLEDADQAFFEKFLQRGNQQVLSMMVNTLGYAASDYEKNGQTWADRARESRISELYANADSAEKNQYDTWYKDPALSMVRAIQDFGSTYNEAVSLREKYGDTFGYDKKDGFDDETTVDEMMEKDPNCRIPEYVNALMTQEMLDGYTYDENQSLADVFLSLAADENLSAHPEALYPFIEGMTAAQRAVLTVCGLNVLIKGLYQFEDYEKERDKTLSQMKKDLKKAGYEDGKISLWEGTDQSLYNKKTAETSDRIEMRNAGAALINSQNDAARKAASNLTIALQVIDISLMALSGVFMIVQACVGMSLWGAGMIAFEFAGMAMTAGLIGMTVGYALLGTLLCAIWVLNILVMVASLCYLVYTILDMCGCFEEVKVPDYQAIPDILFHARKNSDGDYSVRYDAVPSNGLTFLVEEVKKQAEGKGQMGQAMIALALVGTWCRDDVNDLGAFRGVEDKWMTLYVTKAPACGSPMEVKEGESFIRTQLNDYQPPAGCKPVTLINGGNAADINSVNILGSAGTPLYMFTTNGSKQAEQEISEETKPAENGQYISRVRMMHADDRETAINALKKDGFTDIIDVNLTPYSGFTFLAYQYGSKSGALTDIRVSAQGTDPIAFGEASYGRAGLPDSGMTPEGLSLYTTVDPSAGTPIKKISVESKRLELGSGAEPVCLFSGGNAVDFKNKWSDNVYLDVSGYSKPLTREGVKIQKDDPDDGLYIYFWPETEYKAESADSKPPYVAGFSYFLSADDTEFMQKFAKSNGFELLKEGDAPKKMMSDEAAKMNPVGSWQDCEGGALGHDWRYDIYHWMNYGFMNNQSDYGIGAHDFMETLREKENINTTMYFGISYTYNPYRAITGVSGLLAPYTETTNSLRFTGLQTPAGTMQATNVSVQGIPTTQAGIGWGYFSYLNMPNSLYPNSTAMEHYDIPWISAENTEILSHYLLSAGPGKGRLPIGRDDLKFTFGSKPGDIAGYTPVCDMRTPGDTRYPMNLALSTTNIGSEYAYLYIKNSAGGREDDTDAGHGAYNKKHYVAAVYVGTGKTPEAALNNLYAQETQNWKALSQSFPDISKTPLISELDEVIPVDLSDQTPWYTYEKRDTAHVDPSNDEWVYGNDAANMRWGHEGMNDRSLYNDTYRATYTPDQKENTKDYAYIGVVRTAYAEESVNITTKNDDGTEKTTKQTVYPVYGLLKYYTNSSAPGTLSVGDVKCLKAGGPVKSKEGSYYLYYSTNSATASFSAPVTEIDVSEEAFVNGFNTSYSCSDSDRTSTGLPPYSSMRMRTDEFKYLHTKYDMADLPYIESIYLGIGKDKKEAYADLIGTTNANAAADVNCNYNSFSDKWIAIGYRRTSNVNYAVRDLFLYSGDNPPNDVSVDGYVLTQTKKQGKVTTSVAPGQVNYKLIRHNLKSGSEVLSLNEGSGCTGLYLYYAGRKRYAYANDAAAELTPIRNLAFGYGDISPKFASTEELANIYGKTVYGMKIFDAEAYKDPAWEYVTGVEGSPDKYKIDASASEVMSLNFGQIPQKGTDKRHVEDSRVIMYADHSTYSAGSDVASTYAIRSGAALSNGGYYSATSKFGRLRQGK